MNFEALVLQSSPAIDKFVLELHTDLSQNLLNLSNDDLVQKKLNFDYYKGLEIINKLFIKETNIKKMVFQENEKFNILSQFLINFSTLKKHEFKYINYKFRKNNLYE